MSILDIDVDKIELGIVHNKLKEYMIYHYGDIDTKSKRMKYYRGYINCIRSGDFKLVTDIDITENNSKHLVMYYLLDDPSTIYIIRESIVYKRIYNLVYAPIAICPSVRLLTIKDVLGI